MENSILQSLLNHRSIRRYLPDPIDATLLDEILQAAIRAPSAGNLQHYTLLLVDDPEKKKALGLGFAPLVVVALADEARLQRWFSVNGASENCADTAKNLFIAVWDALIALTTLTIAAESRGLGSCYFGDAFNIDMQALFGAPPGTFPAGMVTLGYPAEDPSLSGRLPIEAVVHRNAYHHPSDEEVRDWYRERDAVWETVNPKRKENLGLEGIYSIAQALASQKYSEETARQRNEGVLENITRSGFRMSPCQENL